MTLALIHLFVRFIVVSLWDDAGWQYLRFSKHASVASAVTVWHRPVFGAEGSTKRIAGIPDLRPL